MTVWLGTVYRYFSIDSANDLTSATLDIGDATLTYPYVADQVVSPPSDVASRLAAIEPAPEDGLTRYWWRTLVGVGTGLPMTVGINTLYGRLTDYPEIEPHVWRFRLG